jgi:hypothetical protein
MFNKKLNKPDDLPWKVVINPFGISLGESDNIFIDDSTGLAMLIIAKHPVWQSLEKERLDLANWIVDKVNQNVE